MRQIRYVLPFVTRTHRLVHRVTRGRVGARLPGLRFLFLEHRGRKTGLLRSTPLLWVPDGDRIVLAASNAGQDHHPAWWLNLQADPDTWVVIGRRRDPVRARQAEGEEEDHLWNVLHGNWFFYDSYRRGTDRRIPVVVLEPRSN